MRVRYASQPPYPCSCGHGGGDDEYDQIGVFLDRLPVGVHVKASFFIGLIVGLLDNYWSKLSQVKRLDE